MKQKIFALVMLVAFLLGAVALAFSADTNDKNAARNNQLLTLLPASDAALAFDAKRFFGDALPQILAGNPTMLNEITSKIDEIKSKTGIDIRQFQQVAVGANIYQTPANQIGVEPLILARGQFSSAGLVGIAKLASGGKYREEKIGDRTVYVFPVREAIEQHKSKITNSVMIKILDRALSGLSNEMALTTYDNNTLAIGSLPRVREMFEAKSARLGGEVLAAAARKPNALVSFAAKLPNGLAQFLDLDDDDLGKNLEAIRLLSGSLDVAGGNAVVAISAKTVEPAQAKNLKDFLTVMQSTFAGILKASSKADQKVYGRMLENAKFGQTGHELTLDLQVPQADIDILVGKKQ